MIAEIATADLAGLPLTIGSSTLDTSPAPLVRVSVSLSADSGALVLDISRYTLAGIPLGIVRTKAAAVILARLAAVPGVSCWKDSRGNLRVSVPGWSVVEAGLLAGVVRVRLEPAV